MKQNRTIRVVLACVIIGVGISTMRATASTSVASLWTLDSSGSPTAFKSYDAGQDGWKAVSYERYSSQWAYLLWTKDNMASLWTINSTGAVVGYKTYSAGTASPAWRAVSYNWNPTTQYGKLLWTKDNMASLWTINPTGGLDSYKNFSAGTASPAWQATSYELYSSGWARMLWTRDNTASLWTIAPAGTLTFKTYSAGTASPAWKATSYTWDISTQYAKMAWTRDNTASLWTINPSGSVTSYKTLNAGTASPAWTAQSFCSPNGISAAKTSEFLSAAVLIVKKAGSGIGMISSGAQVCDAACQEMVIPYIAGEKVDLTVTPAADSSFVGWQTAEGVALENIYYANPGDTVYAIFNQ